MSDSTASVHSGFGDSVAAAVHSLPHNVALGFEIVSVERGRCVFALQHRDEFVGNSDTGILHGGVITSLIDVASGTAVYAMVPTGTSVATLDMRIDYLKPAEPGRRILAEAEVYKMTKNVAFVRAGAYQDAATNRIAHCAASFMVGSVGFAVKG